MDWPGLIAQDSGCDSQSQGCFGSVISSYQIGSFEVTNIQYVRFLNAVGQTDPNSLFSALMESSPDGGILRTGASDNYTYAIKPGMEFFPVTFVSFYDALRYVNWLHHGQPAGAQANGTTEDGAYSILPSQVSANSVSRNANARFSLASEDEWFRAAFYDDALGAFYFYPAGSDIQTLCASPNGGANLANCESADGGFSTVVGAYSGSASPSETFDQGGNVWEWTEGTVGSYRVVRGGDAQSNASDLSAGVRLFIDPAGDDPLVGFRVTRVPIPEPSFSTGLAFGLMMLAVAFRFKRGLSSSHRSIPK